MKTYILIAFLLFQGLLQAQSEDVLVYSKNQVFVELFGNGYLYSLNYERSVLRKNKLDASARVGFSYYYPLHNSTYIPLSAQMYYGKKSKLEIGIGYLPIFRWDKIREEGTVFNFDKTKYVNTGNYLEGHDEPYAGVAFVNIGFHQNLKQNFLFKVSFSPWIAEKNNNGYAIIPWGRIAFGKTF